MPNRTAARARDRPRFEDPDRDEAADWLTREQSILPHVRGMRDEDRCRAWIAAAAELGEDQAVELLQQKLAVLRGEAA